MALVNTAPVPSVPETCSMCRAGSVEKPPFHNRGLDPNPSLGPKVQLRGNPDPGSHSDDSGNCIQLSQVQGLDCVPAASIGMAQP